MKLERSPNEAQLNYNPKYARMQRSHRACKHKIRKPFHSKAEDILQSSENDNETDCKGYDRRCSWQMTSVTRRFIVNYRLMNLLLQTFMLSRANSEVPTKFNRYDAIITAFYIS